MGLVRNQGFTPSSNENKWQATPPENGAPSESVLLPLFLKYYLPYKMSRKLVYADDRALLHFFGNWKDLERILNRDITILSAYIQT